MRYLKPKTESERFFVSKGYKIAQKMDTIPYQYRPGNAPWSRIILGGYYRLVHPNGSWVTQWTFGRDSWLDTEELDALRSVIQ